MTEPFALTVPSQQSIQKEDTHPDKRIQATFDLLDLPNTSDNAKEVRYLMGRFHMNPESFGRYKGVGLATIRLIMENPLETFFPTRESKYRRGRNYPLSHTLRAKFIETFLPEMRNDEMDEDYYFYMLDKLHRLHEINPAKVPNPSMAVWMLLKIAEETGINDIDHAIDIFMEEDYSEDMCRFYDMDMEDLLDGTTTG